ncbi:MAG: GNAT family N-acetyltransferase [Limisphaerales bacterium]
MVRTLEEMAPLRDAWASFLWLPTSDIDLIFSTLRVRPEIIRPHIIVVYSNLKPVALLAARLENGTLDLRIGYAAIAWTRVRRIAVFYGGLMGNTTPEITEIIVRQLMRSLCEEKAALLWWPGVGRGTDLHRLLDRNSPPFLRDRFARFVPHWTMTMPESMEELLQKRMNKKQRYNAKRAMQMVEKDFPGQVRYASFSTPDDVEEFFRNSFRIARTTYQWGLGAGFRGSLENKERLVLEATQGRLRGYLMFVKGEPVAFWICTLFNGTAFLNYTGYNPDFRNYEVGTALFLRMIGELCQEYVRQLDFGQGSAFYKEQYGDSVLEEAKFCIFAPTIRGLVLGGLQSAMQGPVEFSRALLKRIGWEQKLKMVWRRSATPAEAQGE